jgi:hypothetical protein
VKTGVRFHPDDRSPHASRGLFVQLFRHQARLNWSYHTNSSKLSRWRAHLLTSRVFREVSCDFVDRMPPFLKNDPQTYTK